MVVSAKDTLSRYDNYCYEVPFENKLYVVMQHDFLWVCYSFKIIAHFFFSLNTKNFDETTF